jgi:GTP-binding protein
MSLPLVAIVGVPNVGKSTLFNRLVGRRRAIVTDEPGVTRDRLYGDVDAAAIAFRLVDTGGLSLRGHGPLARDLERQANRVLSEARAVLFVVDGRLGPTAADREVADMLRRASLPVIVVANKIDVPALEPLVGELHELGLGDPVAVSAEHGLGIDVLLAAVERVLCDAGALPGATGETGGGETSPSAASPAVRVAIVGRPNVGKSSILNRLLGEERALVSEMPGTTRDAVDTLLERDGRRYLLIDTAGLRRRGKARATADSISELHARKSIERADVVVLVLDAGEGFVAQDAHIAGYARESGKSLVVAVNKWDRVERREEAAKAWEADLRLRLRFASGVPVAFVSALSGQRVAKLLTLVDEVHGQAGVRVPTPDLNRWLREVATAERAAPARGRSIRLFYAAQTGVHPPRFVLFCNDARHVHFSLRRHLERGLRERFGFGCAPIHLQFRSRREAKRR